MKRIIKIDRAIYSVDDANRTYQYEERNREWEKLKKEENEKNKQSIHNYRRILKSGAVKKYRRYEHP